MWDLWERLQMESLPMTMDPLHKRKKWSGGREINAKGSQDQQAIAGSSKERGVG